MKVNHKKNFVDPKTKVHTQNIERLWGKLKTRNKRERGTRAKMLDGYLFEFAWRQQLQGRDPFDAILEAMREGWPLGK